MTSDVSATHAETPASTPAGRTTTSWRWSLSDLALVLVVAGTVARVWAWARGRPLWLDEQLIALNIRGRDYAGLADRLDEQQHAPLGWLWLEKLASEAFGTGERTLRLVPMLFGVGTLVVAWSIGRRWLGPVGCIALVGACAASGSMISYSNELKQYSSDTFWVLLLVGLAATTLVGYCQRRLYAWWLVAAVASWLSMASIYVTAGLAVVLIGAWLLHVGWRPALLGAIAGTIWLGAFAAHYMISLRHTLGDTYLTVAWSGTGYPRTGAGFKGTAGWMLRRLDQLAADPIGIGAAAPWVLWLLVATGVIVAAHRRLEFGLLLGVPIATGFVLAIARLVPLSVRLALWLAPVILLAAAAGLDAATNVGVRMLRTRNHPAVGGSVVLAAIALAVAAITPVAARTASWVTTPWGLDDRAAIKWLRANYRDGDLVLAFGSAIRAFQWYEHPPTMRPRMVLTTPPGSGCDNTDLTKTAAGHTRILAYVGVLFGPHRRGSDVLAARLAELGPVRTQRFSRSMSIVYVTDMTAAPVPQSRSPNDISMIGYSCLRVL